MSWNLPKYKKLEWNGNNSVIAGHAMFVSCLLKIIEAKIVHSIKYSVSDLFPFLMYIKLHTVFNLHT